MRKVVFRTKAVQYFSFITVCSLLLQPVVTAVELDQGFYSGNDILYYDPGTPCSETVTTPSTGNGGDVDKNFSLGDDDQQRPVNLVIALMEDYGLKDFQASGLVGNFMHESGGEHLPPNVNEGGNAGPPAFSGGYGWAQWTASRQDAFIAFAVEKGYMANRSVDATDAANYAWLKWELANGYESTITELKKTRNVEQAAISFEATFEKAGKPLMDSRIAKARIVLDRLGGASSSGPTTSESSGSTSGCSTDSASSVGGSVFQNVVFPLKSTKASITEKNSSLFVDGNVRNDFHQSDPNSKYIAYDILEGAGTKVLALTDGTVTALHNGSLGGGVSIYNEQAKLVVYYTHMSPTLEVKVGDKISPGDELGSLASVTTFPGINVDHLHIDASASKVRGACSRSTELSPVCALTRDIGADLNKAYQALP